MDVRFHLSKSIKSCKKFYFRRLPDSVLKVLGLSLVLTFIVIGGGTDSGAQNPLPLQVVVDGQLVPEQSKGAPQEHEPAAKTDVGAVRENTTGNANAVVKPIFFTNSRRLLP